MGVRVKLFRGQINQFVVEVVKFLGGGEVISKVLWQY